MTSLNEIENAFFNHCAEQCVIFTNRPLLSDGALHCVHVEGDKRGTKNGAYILHADGNPSGWFQHFVSGAYGTWTLSGKREPMTAAMRQQIEADRQRRKIEQQQRHDKAADKANTDWRSFQLATTLNPYLVRKKIQSHGAKTGVWRVWVNGKYDFIPESLVLPLFDENLKLRSLQAIFHETHPALGRDKDFLAGGQKRGCFWWLGKKSETVLIAEGFATAASLHEAIGNQIFIAFDAGNLVNVAKIVRAKNPDAEIIICGDNDESGTGQKAARSAALAVGGKYIIPAIVSQDWNDALTMEVAV